MNTATVTVAEARRAIDRLAQKISEHQHAAYQRGLAVGKPAHPIDLRAAQAADNEASLAYRAELDRVTSLVVGLVLERDRASERAWMPGASEWAGPIGGASL